MSHARNLLKRALVEHRRMYLLGTLALLLTSLTEVLTPKFTQWSIDLLSGKGGYSQLPSMFRGVDAKHTLLNLLAGFSILLGLALIGRWGWRQTMARRTHEAGFDLKIRLWESLRFQPLAVFERHTLGDIMSRATADWNASRNIFGFTLVLSWDLIFFTTLSVGLMFSIDPVLAAITLVVWPILPPFIMRLARLERRQHIEAQNRLAILSDLISQSLTSARLQKATAIQDVWTRRLNRDAKLYADQRVEVLRTSWRILPLSAIPTLFAYGVLFSFGYWRMQGGVVTLGEFVALCSYVLLLQGPLFELGNHIAEWQKGLASLDRMSEIFNLRSLRRHGASASAKDSPQTEDPSTLLEIRNLDFTFADGTRLLRGVTLKVGRGESIGIVGPMGAGKSTLIKLVSGMLEPPVGSVYINGEDVSRLSHSDWIGSLSLVPQKSFMFGGTLRHNLSLGEDLSDEQLWSALDIVELGPDVRRWPDQLNTKLGEWGVNLSGGQRQRLALARALLRTRDILLLDDCLSAVDAETEERILGKILPILKTRACIWIAHRASTLRLCQRVYAMIDGTLVPSLNRQTEGALPSTTNTVGGRSCLV